MIRVVIADDHPLMREGVRARLEKQPDIIVVGEASNGEQAVRLVEELHPDVILMDLEMPDVDGLGGNTGTSQSVGGGLVYRDQTRGRAQSVLARLSREQRAIGVSTNGPRSPLGKYAGIHLACLHLGVGGGLHTLRMRQAHFCPMGVQQVIYKCQRPHASSTTSGFPWSEF